MIITINEHNEAFLALSYLAANKKLSSNYSLIHVDEHHDLGRAIIKEKDLEQLDNLQNLKNITYDQIRVSDYILPLVKNNIVNEVIWINNFKTSKDYNCKLTSEYNGEYHILNYQPIRESVGDFRLKLIKLHEGENRTVVQDKSILSIDLDYFSCDDNAGENSEIEITEEAYKTNTEELYSKWKMIFGSKINYYQKNNKFYMTYCGLEGPEEKKRNSKIIIKKKIDELSLFIKENIINPDVILICKSIHSGYTPREDINFIHEEVFKMLQDLYNTTNNIDISDLTREVLNNDY